MSCAHVNAPGDVAARLAPGEQHAEALGAEIVYHVAGQGPVLLAHPGGPGMEWTYLRMPEVERRFTVVYIEPVGTGKSGRLPKPTDYTLSRYVEDVEMLRQHLGLDRIHFLGHSYGSFVGMSYALTHPSRLQSLILYSTTPTTGPEWQKDVESNLSWFEKEPWFEDASKALAEETKEPSDEAVTALFRRRAPFYFANYSAHEEELKPLIAAMRLFIAHSRMIDPSAPEGTGGVPVFEVRDKLNEIRVPTLILSGRKDFVTSVKMAKVAHEGITGSRHVIFEGSGHMIHVEERAAFAAAITNFLTGSAP